MDGDQFSSQLKEKIGQLRADFNAAFGGTEEAGDKQGAEKDYPKGENAKQLIKLTEYLLHIKEKQTAELEKKSDRYYRAALRLSGALLNITSGSSSPDSILADLCGAIDANSIIIWHQTGKEHLTGTVNIDKTGGEELFLSVLPYLSDNNIDDAVFTKGEHHFIANTRPAEDSSSVFAVLYIRSKERDAFEEAEGIFAAVITDIIQNLFKKQG